MRTETELAERIDNLTPGSFVELEIDGDFENALFVGVRGKGDERRAAFVQMAYPPPPHTFEWEAYRFNGHWAYGSSAELLRLSAVLVEP